MREQLGSRTQLTGDGGDSVLFVPAPQLADLLCHRLYRRAAGEGAGWSRLRHRPILPLLRKARALTRSDRTEALADLATALEDRGPPAAGRGDVRSFPALPQPLGRGPRCRDAVRRRPRGRRSGRSAARPGPASCRTLSPPGRPRAASTPTTTPDCAPPTCGNFSASCRPGPFQPGGRSSWPGWRPGGRRW